MEIDKTRNRKLLVSVFNPQEAREGVIGGGRIIDSEDPRSALGNIRPRQIMNIAHAVLDQKRDLEIQLSTNIGEDQLLYDRSEDGIAIQKSPYEIAGKASQAAMGVALSMSNGVNNCPIIKVGVDGMPVELVKEVLSEVVETLKDCDSLSNCNVMSVLFAQDLNLWDSRKTIPSVRKTLVGLREFRYSEGDDAFSLMDNNYLVKTLRKGNGDYLFNTPDEVPDENSVVNILKEIGALPSKAKNANVQLNELFPHKTFFPDVNVPERRTNKEVIAAMVDATYEAGAHSIMLDTRIQSKVARLSLAKTSANGLIDLNRLDVKNNLSREGILPLEDLRFFVDYCHFRNLKANLAGSFQSYQAQQVWLKIPYLDQISTRGGSSSVLLDPRSDSQGSDTRQFRVTNRNLVKGLVPPEQGGVLNIPDYMTKQPNAQKVLEQLENMLAESREEQGLPQIESFITDKFGNQTPL